jgi:hypothetical protein
MKALPAQLSSSSGSRDQGSLTTASLQAAEDRAQHSTAAVQWAAEPDAMRQQQQQQQGLAAG